MRQLWRYRAHCISSGSILLAVILLLVSSCGGGTSSRLEKAAQEQLSSGLPELSALKAPAGIGVDSKLGNQTFLRSSGAVDEIVDPLPIATALRLDSSDGGHFEWAIYSINPANPLIELQVSQDSLDASDEAFIALANYESNAWDLTGPHTSASDTGTPEPDSGIFILPLDEAVNRSDNGAIFAAVLSPLGSNVRVIAVNATSTTPDAPVADIQATWSLAMRS